MKLKELLENPFVYHPFLENKRHDMLALEHAYMERKARYEGAILKEIIERAKDIYKAHCANYGDKSEKCMMEMNNYEDTLRYDYGIVLFNEINHTPQPEFEGEVLHEHAYRFLYIRDTESGRDMWLGRVANNKDSTFYADYVPGDEYDYIYGCIAAMGFFEEELTGRFSTL